MKEILLTRGYKVLVDDEDFEELSKYKWSVDIIHGKPYASRKVFMHRMILKDKDEKEVDHKDNNGLNNQKKNLRYATDSQNSANQPKRKINNFGNKPSSQYKGVCFRNRNTNNQWEASIVFHGKWIGLGCYSTELEAARAYDKKALELFGEFARLNNV